MARIRKSTLSFDAITLEGSLISPAKFAEIAERKASEQTDADYAIPKGLNLRDEAARYFRIGQALFLELHASGAPSLAATIRFTTELLREVFGFTDIVSLAAPRTFGDRTFPVTLEAFGGRVPVVVVPPADTIDHTSPSLSHDHRRSAASALQDWLNADENSLWGLCTNGECLRLLRDNESLTRPAYLEADLRQIFEGDDIASFSALRLALYASRFGKPATPPTDCPLERWREAGGKEGLAARDRLREGFESALLALGNGFLTHPENADLAAHLRDGKLPLDRYFSQLLRLVYRLIFLLAAEDRNLLHPPEAPAAARKLYAEGYSLGALRDRAIRRSGWDNFHDRWEGLRITFGALADGQAKLGLPALGGIFARSATPELDSARLSNRALMEAIFRLAWLRDDGLLMPVNWRDMETEELGSVYESLLELVPRLTADGRGFAFAEGIQQKGNARKTSGSYYTPDSLVQALLDSALDPVLDRVESESADPVAGLLALTVIDPACGSGHFLLAAARRIATRVARLRSGGVPTPSDYRHALRDVVRSTIHGTDRNPMAVELTKVALWIETVEPGKPLGFLDANIRCGDSLLGIFDLKALEKGIPDAAYKPLTGDDRATAKDFDKRNKSEKGQKTRLLDFAAKGSHALELPPLAQSLRAVRELPEDTVEQIEAKRERFTSASHDPRLQNLAHAADLYIAAFLSPKTDSQSLDLRTAPVPTTEDVWTALRGGTVYGPRLGAARQLSSDARAFHWPLEFPDIFNHGGFDIILGNPPWEVMQLGEEEYFAQYRPEIAELAGNARKLAIASLRESHPPIFAAYESEKRRFEASNEFARCSGRFDLTARGKVNTYGLFAELFLNLKEENARAGIVVPTGIALNEATSSFFSQIVESLNLVSLWAFDEIKRWFAGTKDNQSFCLLVLGSNLHQQPKFAFQIGVIDQLLDARRVFSLTAEDFRRMNPNTRTCAVFRAKADAALTKSIYSRVPVLLNNSSRIPINPWRVRFSQGLFNMTSDSAAFRTTAQLESEEFTRDRYNWVRSEGDRVVATYIPLYESKMFHQFDHRFGFYSEGDVEDTRALPRPSDEEKGDFEFEVLPRYWVSGEDLDSKLLSKEWSPKWLMGWRNITNSTNERTLIASVLPRCAVGHSTPLIFTESEANLALALLCNFDSLTTDYVVRQKMGGVNLTFNIVEQLPILPPEYYSKEETNFIANRALELTYTSHSMAPFARDLGYDGPPFPWNEDRRALLRAELDAWYARAYGLTRDELRYILDPADVMGPDYPSQTFRVLRDNEERKFGEYRTRRLVLDAWDRMERGELPKPEPYQRPATEPTTISAAAPRRAPAHDTSAQPGLQFTESDAE